LDQKKKKRIWRVIPNSQKNGLNLALFKSLYQDDKKILPRQVNEA
jgi:hypothetical protein